ncbi:polysaccharide deacetylase family protein [Breoghania sp.]|uniref:polysaccharide deacetylase family protein n=1 Tax=Breoghania sp. TaxID=2065378 RepID=UPI002AA8E693|nr:polysaccharide deacetylase family protein [Breoghania sp.]
MSGEEQDEREAFRSALKAHLDGFAARGQTISLWWRDDDAIEPTPALDRMLALAKRYGVDIGLAVIPKGAGEALAERLRQEPHAVVLQHGWRHKNHQIKAEGEKAAELGTRRDMEEVLGELTMGREKLEGLFGEKFIPALVPPWNRISDAIAQAAPGIGLPGLSTFTSKVAMRPHRLQTHLDPIKWKENGRFIGWGSARRRFDEILEARSQDPSEPIGLLSHHLVMDDDHFAFFEDVLEITAAHPAAKWPPVRRLFAL